jgi:hypothetical protein
MQIFCAFLAGFFCGLFRRLKMKREALLTVGDIAKKYGIPPAKVAYAIAKFGVAESQRAGIFRLYTPREAARVADLVSTIRGVGTDGTA